MKSFVFTLELPDDWTPPSIDDIKRLADPDWLADWWHADDIQGQCDWLTDEEAREALKLIDKHSNPTIGINWDSIDAIVYEHFTHPDEE